MIHKAGFVNIIGNPNVGKSTLMNTLVGEKLSIITAKAQTTRHRILGILNEEDFQIVFSDTPGIIKPAYALQESMMNFVKTALEDADVILYMVELGEKDLKDKNFFKQLQQTTTPVIILINKIDKGDQQQLEAAVQHWKENFPKAEIYPISAIKKFGTTALLDRIKDILPESPPYFPKDSLTDKSERFIVNETIREKILLHFKKEIPYAVEVITESFKEEEKIIRIQATILVERDTQKGILIGHKGAALKRVGVEARSDLEAFFDKKIFLELFVKVQKNWRADKKQLRKFGYEG